MNKDDFKKFNVLIDIGGSGCLFQPMTKKYTYILTAKHLFYETKETEQGQEFSEEIRNGTIFNIYRFVKTPEGWDKVLISFTKSDDTFFPHNEADLAILKIDYIEGFDKINIEEALLAADNYELCGYPSNVRVEREYTTHRFENFIANNGYFQSARLFHALKQDDIEGMSGGGILRLNDGSISIIGIQSKMGNQIFPAGEIGYVPIKFFNDIIKYSNNKDVLSPLLPYYMKDFKHLANEVFKIHAGPDDSDIIFTRKFLQNKTKEIVESDITPIYIKDFFNIRLLLNSNDISQLNNKVLYVTWLEFLTILNIAQETKHCGNDLEHIFNIIRLLYKNTNHDWQASDFLEECLNCEFEGLNIGGTVLIKTNVSPKMPKQHHYKIDRKSLVPNITRLKRSYYKGEVGDVFIDDASGQTKEFVFDQFNFYHFEFLKEYMLVWECEKFKEYNANNVGELLIKLKEEYGKVFRIE